MSGESQEQIYCLAYHMEYGSKHWIYNWEDMLPDAKKVSRTCEFFWAFWDLVPVRCSQMC